MPEPTTASRLRWVQEKHGAQVEPILGAICERWARDLGRPVPADVAALRPELLTVACRSDVERLLDRFPLSQHADPLAWAVEALSPRKARRVTHHTPALLIQLILSLAGRVSGTVYDPACGTGGLLLAAAGVGEGGARYVGQELDPVSWSLARISAELRGVQIDVGEPGDTLAAPQLPSGGADLVLANPPWARATNFAWVEHCVEALADGGRAIIVLPHSVCTDEQGRGPAVRQSLVEQGWLRAVIALPRGVFAHSRIPPVVWVVEKSTGDGTMMVDGRDTDLTTDDGVEQLALAAVAEVSGVSRRVGRQEIADSGYRVAPLPYLAVREARMTVGDIASVQSSPSGEILGRRHHLPAGEQGVPVLEARNLNGWIVGEMARVSEADARRLARYAVQPGDVLIARRGRLDRVAVVGEGEGGAIYGTSVIRVRPNAPADGPRIADQLCSPQTQAWLRAHSTGSTLPHVTQAVVAGVAVESL